MIQNENNNNNNISISELRLRPFDPTSKVAHEYPGADRFDDRSDFIMFRHQSHVAVYMEVVNEYLLSGIYRSQSASLTVWLLDITAGEAVAAKTVALTFSAEELCKQLRVDLSLAYADADGDHDYRVRVTHTATGAVLGEKAFRLYDMPRIGKLPTRWYKPVSGWVEMAVEFLPERLCGIDMGDCVEQIDAVLCVESALGFTDVALLPEVELRITGPDGKQQPAVMVRPTSNSIDGDPDGVVRVVQRIDVDLSRRGLWYVEARCMGYAFAAVAFGVGCRYAGEMCGDELAPMADYTVERAMKRWGRFVGTPKPEEKPVAEADSLDALVGLSGVKSRLEQYTQLVRLSRLRERTGLPGLSMPLHAMFLGSPGTGKTTVAKIIGERLRRIGVLSEGHVVVRERASLIGQYYSSESENTRKALEEARGGILFIDEAYQLYQPDDPKDPGRFVIETLMTALADESDRDWMLILAGYPEPMKAMFAMNPGLRSRIPASNIYTFDDFTADELMEIARRYFSGHRFVMTDEAARRMEALLAHDCLHRDGEFGNARHVVNLIQTSVLPAMAMRLAAVEDPTVEQLSLIEASDIPAPQLPAVAQRRRLGFAV